MQNFPTILSWCFIFSFTHRYIVEHLLKQILMWNKAPQASDRMNSDKICLWLFTLRKWWMGWTVQVADKPLPINDDIVLSEQADGVSSAGQHLLSACWQSASSLNGILILTGGHLILRQNKSYTMMHFSVRHLYDSSRSLEIKDSAFSSCLHEENIFQWRSK